MTDAEQIAERIQKELPTLKRGTLRFWGQWFGRPHDNWHTVKSSSAEGDVLQILFDNGETLRVVRPRRALINSTQFIIGDADSLRWEWNAYGNPPGRRYFEEYVRNGDKIDARTDVDWYTPVLRPSSKEVALEIV